MTTCVPRAHREIQRARVARHVEDAELGAPEVDHVVGIGRLQAALAKRHEQPDDAESIAGAARRETE